MNLGTCTHPTYTRTLVHCTCHRCTLHAHTRMQGSGFIKYAHLPRTKDCEFCSITIRSCCCSKLHIFVLRASKTFQHSARCLSNRKLPSKFQQCHTSALLSFSSCTCRQRLAYPQKSLPNASRTSHRFIAIYNSMTGKRGDKYYRSPLVGTPAKCLAYLC